MIDGFSIQSIFGLTMNFEVLRCRVKREMSSLEREKKKLNATHERRSETKIIHRQKLTMNFFIFYNVLMRWL